MESSGISVLIIGEPLKEQSLELFKRYSDKYLSFTDCTSFVMMKRQKIQWHAGFDDHFNQMGFTTVLAQVP